MTALKRPGHVIGDVFGLWVTLFSIVAVGGKRDRRDERTGRWVHRGRSR